VNQAALIDSLIKHEGLKLKPYKCTAGKTTIGIGRNLDDNGITEAEAMLLVKNDVDTCVTELDRTRPNWRQHNEIRQNVLVEMVFNLGMPRLNKFTKMWAALDAKAYTRAAAEMLDSNWAFQVGGRALTLADQMKAGK
jgi:lysozyme